ncbi:MAG: hypothetical protein U0637_11205 [Phycisphaerales bacterium]
MPRTPRSLCFCGTAQACTLLCALLAATACSNNSAKPAEPTPANQTDPKKTAARSPFTFKKRAEREAAAAAAEAARASASSAPRAGAPNGVFDNHKNDNGWSILVMTFQGAGAREAAAQAVAQFAAQTGLPNARSEPSTSIAGAWALLQGAYPGPDDPRAKSDLAVVRQIAPGAILVPPATTASTGTIPDFDLSTLKQRLTSRNKGPAWSLQVGYYGHPDRHDPTDSELAQFRAAAEKAVLELRSGGEEAFYYHSPRGSTVTVGVFGDNDQKSTMTDPVTGKVIQLQTTQESPQLMEARARHPLNLVNGAPVLVKNKGATTSVEQPSFLVRVPGT